MKKNKFMRLASGLLVGTLLTTCAISGTFAKYTTQDDGNDSARVAKWGVELQVVGTLFGENYLKDENTVTSSTDDTKISVESTNLGGVVTPDTLDTSDNTVNITNLVAPGTKANDVFGIKLNGVPEVDYKIEASLTAQNVWLKAGSYGHMVEISIPVTDENILDLAAAEEENDHNNGVAGLYYSTDVAAFTKVDAQNAQAALATPNVKFYTLEDGFKLGQDYYPVVYSLGGADTAVTNTQDDCYSDTLLEISNEIMNRLGGSALTSSNAYTYTGVMEKVYDSNVDISALGLKNTTISWAWEFDRADPDCDDGATDEDYDACVTCQADTFLGNLVATNTVNVIDVVVDNAGNATAINETTAPTYYNLVTEFDLAISVTQVD